MMMKGHTAGALLAVACAGLLVGALASPAQALSLNGTYYVLSATHPDTSTLNSTVDGATVQNLVDAGLFGTPGTQGAAPVKCTGVGCGTTLVPITDVATVGSQPNVIQWWTVHSGVTLDTVTPTHSDALNFNFASNFFPNGNGNDASGYRAVHWTGVFQALNHVRLSLSADDDAWLFLNGIRTLDNGGIKAIGLSTTTTADLGPGVYTLDLFFADRHTTQSALIFNCASAVEGGQSCVDPIGAVPEPTTLLLLGTTLVGLGTVVRRRMRGGAKDIV